MTKNYVKEYKGHKVPEGATHYASETKFQRVGFYKENGFKPQFFSVNLNEEWVNSINKKIPATAIELPLATEIDWDSAPEWDGKGLPPIGMVCETTHNGKNEPCEILRGHDDAQFSAVMIISSNRLYWIDNSEIRPLKTQEQKDREAFIEACFSKSKRAQENSYITNIFEDLFNSGFKAPEGEK